MALSQKFAVKLRTGAIVHDFAVIFVDVVCNGKQRDFCRNLLFSSEQKLPEFVIFLDDAKSSLGLYASVGAKQYSHGRSDVVKGFFLCSMNFFDRLILRLPLALVHDFLCGQPSQLSHS